MSTRVFSHYRTLRHKLGLGFVVALLALVAGVLLPGAKPASAQSSGEQDAAALVVGSTHDAARFYIVQPGDTLSSIAARHNTDVSTLLRLNPRIQNPNRIRVGESILVPVPSQPPNRPNPGPGRPPVQPPVQLPSPITLTYIHMIALGTSGPLGCGDTVAPVLQEISATNAVLRATLERLLSIRSQFYRQTGLYNALHLSQLTISDVSIVNRVATIRLSGQIVMSGTCDGPRIQAQLEQAALQFSTVDQVRVFINGNALQSVLSSDGQ